MKQLILSHLPDDVEQRHVVLRGESVINGGDTFYGNAVAALLRFSSYDRILVCSQAQQSRFMLGKVGDRTYMTGPLGLQSLPATDDLVFFTPTESLGRILPLRQYIRRPESPVVGFFHAVHPAWVLPKMAQMLISGLSSHDAVICASESSRAAAQCLFSRILPPGSETSACSMPLIPNGVDCDVYGSVDQRGARDACGFSDHEVVILFVGRFNMFGKADLGPLIEVFRRIRNEGHSNAKLVLAGADHADRLAAQMRDYCAARLPHGSYSVVANPSQSEKLSLYAAADIFVSPAEGVAESFGLSIIEAMASGLPVLASDWDGYRETVVHGETGYRIPTAWIDLEGAPEFLECFGLTAVSTLAAATALSVPHLHQYLKALILDRNKRKTLGEAGRQRARKLFHWPVVIRRYEDVFSEAILSGRNEHRQRPIQPLTHQEQFERYPTSGLSEGTMLVRTPCFGDMPSPLEAFHLRYVDGDNSIKGRETHAFEEFGLFDPTLIGLVLDELDHKPRSMGDVLEASLRGRQIPKWLVKLTLMRLIKYGYITQADQDATVASQDMFPPIQACH